MGRPKKEIPSYRFHTVLPNENGEADRFEADRKKLGLSKSSFILYLHRFYRNIVNV